WSSDVCSSDLSASDIARRIRRQEQNRLGLLIQGPVAVHEAAVIGLLDQRLVPGFLLLALLLGIAWGQARWCFGAARSSRVDADALLGIFERQVHRQSIHPGLGCAVGH